MRVDDAEGCAERTCAKCGSTVLMLDPQDFAGDADLLGTACPCGNVSINVGVGFAPFDDEDGLRWVGLRCTRDSVLGCYADWKIDYSPSRHLLEHV